jgi:hypothetical protein
MFGPFFSLKRRGSDSLEYEIALWYRIMLIVFGLIIGLSALIQNPSVLSIGFSLLFFAAAAYNDSWKLNRADKTLRKCMSFLFFRTQTTYNSQDIESIHVDGFYKGSLEANPKRPQRRSLMFRWYFTHKELGEVVIDIQNAGKLPLLKKAAGAFARELGVEAELRNPDTLDL